MAKPSTSQLKFLIYLVVNGGSAYAPDKTRPATVRSCLDHRWIERGDGGPYEVKPLRITIEGCDMAVAAEPLAAEIRDALTQAAREPLDNAIPAAADVTADEAAGIAAAATNSGKVVVFTSGDLREFSPTRASGIAVRLTW